MTLANAPGSPFEKYRHIVVEGPIGAGKTSLARKLAERFGAQPVLEDPAGNPFLERFYADSRRYALPTQLFFLFQRVNQLRDLAQQDLFTQAMVGDFLLDKDQLFARLTLDDDELRLYQQIFDSLRPQAPTPDLVIYLQAQPDTLVERVARRGLAMEAGQPLLIVNTEHLNPIERDEDFSTLVRQLAEIRGRRSFFNIGE